MKLHGGVGSDLVGVAAHKGDLGDTSSRWLPRVTEEVSAENQDQLRTSPETGPPDGTKVELPGGMPPHCANPNTDGRAKEIAKMLGGPLYQDSMSIHNVAKRPAESSCSPRTTDTSKKPNTGQAASSSMPVNTDNSVVKESLGSTPVLLEMARALTAAREELMDVTASANRTSHMACERIKSNEEAWEKVNHRLLESEAKVATADAQRLAVIHESEVKADQMAREHAAEIELLKQHLSSHQARDIEEEKAKVRAEADLHVQRVLQEQQSR